MKNSENSTQRNKQPNFRNGKIYIYMFEQTSH